ncbi:MAG: hypothetical protein JNM59_09015 [Hyphomonadaceae bacterium]|nr:hypothetical protein [Hyphomonadaceae bacterium]
MAQATPATIELKLESLAHLFDPYDPFPIPSRDLAKSAEEFIVGWAREVPRDAKLKIVVHAPAGEVTEAARRELADAIARHFAYRAERVTGDLHELFRVGYVSLGIGLAVLAACVIGGRVIDAAFAEAPWTRFLSEGLIILGWVANWRPLEIFLYEWWPLAQRRRLYRRLAQAPVEVRAA